MIKKTLIVKNQLGLHARAAARLVSLTSRFTSKITLSRTGKNEFIDGKSILGILMMAASMGTQISFMVSGSDESEAIAAIEELFDNDFQEKQ